jgi:acyl carrier protein
MKEKDEKLNKVLSEVLGIELKNYPEDKNFEHLDVWDSMTFMIFIARIEEEFECQLTNEEILQVLNISKLKGVLENK